MSYTWRNILQANWILEKGGVWNIGSGEDIHIWEDNWIYQRGNATSWSIKPQNTNLVKVKYIMVENGWDIPTISQLFIPIEAKQITQLPLYDRSQKDVFRWDGTLDGHYTVKAGYHAIIDWATTSESCGIGPSHSPNDIWDKLWQLNVPPKHVNLVWRALKDVIPVKTNLFRKGILCDPLCPCSHNHMESTNHVFLEYEWAKLTWLSSPLTVNLSNNQYTNLIDWFLHMSNETDKKSMEIIISTIYGIW
jgi:hypothetical protein